MSSRVFSVSVLLPFLLFVGRIYANHTYVSSFLKFGYITGRIFTTSQSLFMSTDGVFGSRSAVTSYLDVVFDRLFGLIDVLLTSHAECYATSGSLHLGLSDHDLIFTVRKIKNSRPKPRLIEFRSMKNFNLPVMTFWLT